MANPLDAALSELYGATPEQFLEVRKALAARLKQQGHAPAAKELSAQKKPTRLAHLLNLLSRTHPDDVAELGRIGAELAKAHATSADALRAAIAEQRRAVQALTAKAAVLMRTLDIDAGELATVSGALTGATTSPERAAELALGRLVKAPEPPSSFFAGVSLPVQAATPAPAGAPKREAVDHDEEAEKTAWHALEQAEREARVKAHAAEQEAKHALMSAQKSKHAAELANAALAEARRVASQAEQAAAAAQADAERKAQAAAEREAEHQRAADALTNRPRSP